MIDGLKRKTHIKCNQLKKFPCKDVELKNLLINRLYGRFLKVQILELGHLMIQLIYLQDKKINAFDIASGKPIKSFKQDKDFGDPIKVSNVNSL